jgi:hypothetical protein
VPRRPGPASQGNGRAFLRQVDRALPNFRFARQPSTIVTWGELDFYDLPLIRPSGFVNRAAFSAVIRLARAQGVASRLLGTWNSVAWEPYLPCRQSEVLASSNVDHIRVRLQTAIS